MTIEVDFSKEDIDRLYEERFSHPHPRIQLKMEVLWLKSQGVHNEEIARLTKICLNTVRSYIRDYKDGGIEKLKEIPFYKPTSDLEEHKESIEAYFRKNPPKSCTEAAKKIEEMTGIKRSPKRVCVFLKSSRLKFNIVINQACECQHALGLARTSECDYKTG